MLRAAIAIVLLAATGAAPVVATPRPTPGPNLLVVPVIAPTPTPPPPLRCLEKYYELGSTRDASGKWFALLADGTKYAYDDGREKTFEEKLEDPDIEDAFEIRYPTGADVVPVTDPSEDEGRIRLDPVFKATYGKTAKQVELVKVAFLGRKILVNRRAADAFGRVAKRLAEVEKQDPSTKKFFEELGGTYNWRTVAGTSRPSAHAFGISIDLNPKYAEYWRWTSWANGKTPPKKYSGAIAQPAWKHPLPKAIVDAFEAEGFVWGGRWYHFDTMHFEWRPELTDPDCYPDDARSLAKN